MFEEYYSPTQPATAHTFRQSVGIFRRFWLEMLDIFEMHQDMRAQLALLAHQIGRPEVLVAVGPPKNHVEQFVDRRRRRKWFRLWRVAVLRQRRRRELLWTCFAAWAWHPDGALLPGLKRRCDFSASPCQWASAAASRTPTSS